MTVRMMIVFADDGDDFADANGGDDGDVRLWCTIEMYECGVWLRCTMMKSDCDVRL